MNVPTITATYLVETTTPDAPMSTVRELIDVQDGRPDLLAPLEHITRAIEAAAELQDDCIRANEWDTLAAQVEADRDGACNLDPAGLRYMLPDGRKVEATRLDPATLDAMTTGFVRAALWTNALPLEMGENGETGGLENLEPTSELRAKARELCARFLAANPADVEAHMDGFGDPDGSHPGEYVGHTFYLDACGSGVSFTDRAWRDDDELTPVCQRLCESACAFPEVEWITPYQVDDETVGLS